jgi:hypothetical protein
MNFKLGIAITASFLLFGCGERVLKSSTSPEEVQTDPGMFFPPGDIPEPILYPGQLLNLENWKLMIPIDGPDPGTVADEILQPQLNTFSIYPYFHLNDAVTGVVFQANAGGALSSTSKYPRSELHEMTNGGTVRAGWSTTVGRHEMFIREAITHLPVVKPDVTAGQIHDSTSDLIMIKLHANRLFVEGNAVDLGTLDSNYVLGTIFTVDLLASSGRVKVYYNDVLKLDIARSSTGDYFKAGCYTLSNPTQGDAPSAYGEVIIYVLTVTHT